jgi:hypothetical protein
MSTTVQSLLKNVGHRVPNRAALIFFCCLLTLNVAMFFHYICFGGLTSSVGVLVYSMRVCFD